MRALLILVMAACGDGPSKTTIRGEPTLETFERRMCACADAACAKQVVVEMAAWSKKVKAPRADVEDTARTMRRYNACMAEVSRRR